ncbi:MAG: beta-glucosidase, partial [Clostridia bacterium]|nr:beta-glucosidase [Clostridia bacterium]
MNKKQLNELLNSLTLEQKIGQLFQVPGIAYNKDAVATGDTYSDWLKNDEIENAGSTLNIFDNKKLREIQKEHLEKNPVPLLFMADIINGYRLVFPSSIAQGCSFNPSLAEKAAKIAAYEASKCGISVTFSPMIDVARDARWGRISEGYGESSLLNCDFGVANVKGYQGDDLSSDDTIAACVKHFAGYGTTTDGRDYTGAEMPERLFKTVYLPPFKACVKAGARLIMPAFCTVNGVPCTINKNLIKDTLHDEWQFKGVTISDFGAIKDSCDIGGAEDYADVSKKALECGVDIDMGDETYSYNLKTLVQNGEVDEKLIDEAVMRVLTLKNDLGVLDDPYKYIKQ